VVNKKTRQRKKYQNKKHHTLNAAIGIVGVFLLAFIYSFSKNSSHNGISMEEITFPDQNKPRELAANIYEKRPIHQVKVEILNGCGIKGLAAKTAEYLLLEHQIDVVKSDNADNHNYPKTLIIGRNEKFQSIELLSKSFGIPFNDKSVIQHQPDESLGVDVTVILGKDINNYTKLFDYIAKKN
tara:strand:+ start:433 stop:981 length:549 start_codon:yes stop_codon:yes gene_type:complete